MFIIATKSTDEGWEVQRRDIDANIIDVLYQSTSKSLVHQVFKQTMESIDPEWFKIAHVSTDKDNYAVVYKPKLELVLHNERN